MGEEIKKIQNRLIEKLILDYQKWWKQDDKEKWHKLLLRALKMKYEPKK